MPWSRHLEEFQLALNGAPLEFLAAPESDSTSAVVLLTNRALTLPGGARVLPQTISLRRTRFLRGGLHERLELVSYNREPIPFRLELTLGADFRDIFVAYPMGEQRPVSGTWSVERGQYFNGHITAVSHQRGRIALTPQLSIQPGLSINRIELPQTTVTLKLVTSRVTYTVTPRMFVSGLIQFNSITNSLGSNFRFRWEYQPGSEFFLVYNDVRDTSPRGPMLLENRSFVVKLTRQFRL